MTDESDQPGDQPADPQGGAASEPAARATGADSARRFRIQKVFVKDVSFESPAAPGIFSASSDFDPRISLQLNSEQRRIGEDLYEVTLIVTVTSADDDTTAFLVEIKQAGLFEIAGLSDADRAHALGSYCPGILFPYARELVASLVLKGGFPHLALQPVNFDLLFARQVERTRRERAERAGADGGDSGGEGAAADTDDGRS